MRELRRQGATFGPSKHGHQKAVTLLVVVYVPLACDAQLEFGFAVKPHCDRNAYIREPRLSVCAKPIQNTCKIEKVEDTGLIRMQPG